MLYIINENNYHYQLLIEVDMKLLVESQKTVMEARFDPELPTAQDVLMAISCVATQYAINPSLSLAKTALSLANNLNAPEYTHSAPVKEVAKRLTMKWECIVEEYLFIGIAL